MRIDTTLAHLMANPTATSLNKTERASLSFNVCGD